MTPKPTGRSQKLRRKRSGSRSCTRATLASSKSSGFSVKHYIVLRSDRGLKLYLGTNHGFYISKDGALSFVKKEDAEMTAMRQTYADPRFIGRLEVVDEEENNHQDLSLYKIGDLVDTFGDIRFDVSAVSICR